MEYTKFYIFQIWRSLSLENNGSAFSVFLKEYAQKRFNLNVSEVVVIKPKSF